MDNKATEKERFEIVHKMSRRIASVDKMVETAIGMGWQDLDEDELQKKLDSFILIYGE